MIEERKMYSDSLVGLMGKLDLVLAQQNNTAQGEEGINGIKLRCLLLYLKRVIWSVRLRSLKIFKPTEKIKVSNS